jgi:hypothetical protein
MISQLRNNVTLFLLKNKYSKSVNDETNKNNFIKNAKSILIIMPENDEDYRYSFEIAKYLGINNKNVSLVLPDYRYSLVDRHLNFQLITYDIKSKSLLNLPCKILAERLQEKYYDVIIDLNRTENLFFTSLALIPTTSVRVGVNKDKTICFYNIRFNISENNSEISYRNLLTSLSMF